MVLTSVSPRRRAAESALRGRRVAVFSCALYCVILSCCGVMSGIWAQTSVGTANEDERRLIYDLFKNYNKIIRPAKDPNETLSVGFQQAMIQVKALIVVFVVVVVIVVVVAVVVVVVVVVVVE